MLRSALLARAALLVAVASAAAPAPASADDVDVSIPDRCYVAYPGSELLDAYGDSIPVEAEGLPPNAPVRLTLEVKGVQTASSPLLTTTKGGTLDANLDTWVAGMGDGPTKETPARIVIRDYWIGTELGSGDVKVANIGGLIDGEMLSIHTKRRWFVSGLSEVSSSGSYYAHYFLPSGKQFAKQYLGKTQDRCGFLRVKRVALPGKVHPKEYEIRIQALATFKKSEPYIPFAFVTVGM